MLTFSKIERGEVDALGEAVVQSATVAENFLRDPRTAAAANDEHDVFFAAGSGPTVPEMLQRTDEIRLGRVHPRQLVQKHHFFLLRPLRKHLLQHSEGLHPRARDVETLAAGALQRVAEARQLLRQWCLGKSSVLKGKLIVEGLADEVGLAHAPPSVDGAELGFLFFQQVTQNGLLLFPSNQHSALFFLFSMQK